MESRGQSEDELAVLNALRKLSPVTIGVKDHVTGLNPAAYRQKYLESLRQVFSSSFKRLPPVSFAILFLPESILVIKQVYLDPDPSSV